MRLRDRWHVVMGEMWGWVSYTALIKIANHATKARDELTVYRCAVVIKTGIESGWDKCTEDKGKIVPGRNAQLVTDALAELARRRDRLNSNGEG